MRGSVAAWEALQATPQYINDDTLYFIYENAQTSKNGKLYLGQKLISGGGNGNITGDININDIGDVYIDNEILAHKQILVYNAVSKQWENVPLSVIIDTAIGIMVGATASENGQSGLVPMPRQGDQNKFLRGDGTWTTINIPTFKTSVFTLNNNEVSLNNYDLAPVGSIPIKTEDGLQWSNNLTGKLDRKITTLEKLQAQLSGTDPDPISTDTIYMVLKDDNGLSTDAYDEYMVIENRLEKLGSFGEVSLSDYVQVTTFNNAIKSLNDILQDTIDENTQETIPGLISRVNTLELNSINSAAIGNLNQLLLTGDNTTLVEEVNTINDRLKWHELNVD